MNKPWVIGLTIVLPVLGTVGIMHVAKTMRTGNQTIATAHSKTPAEKLRQIQVNTLVQVAQEDNSGPFFGQKPEDINKSYQEMIKESEEQKKAEEENAQKKNTKQTTTPKNTNKTTEPIDHSKTVPSESPGHTPAAEPEVTPEKSEKPESEPEKSEKEDFMRGY